jgi:O-antigen ligase
LDWVPPAALSVLLLVATWYNGAFALRHWAPVALLGLAILAAAAASGALWVPERAARLALLALWGFAAWTLLSAIWAESPGRALEGAGRTALYASLFTVPCAMTWNGRNAARVGGLLVASLATIAGITLVELLADPESLFLAGRLDDPVGYRNATACLFAVAFWPLVSAAAHHGLSPALRAPAFSAGALVLGLAFLTQARGVALGLLLGGAVAIGLGPDRLRRAWVAAILVGGLALASDRLLTPFHAFSDSGDATAADISPAVDALVVLVLASLAVGLVGALFDGGLRLAGPARATIRRTMAAGLVLATLAAAVGAVAAVGNPLSFVSDRYDEFRSLETTAPGDSRLTFGGGQRADLWRVALDEFEAQPLTGVGEGSYAFRYYEERRTDRNLSTPHSLAFSVIAELGAVGALLLLLFLGALCAAVASRWRRADPRARWWASALLAAATVGLGESTVDWIWLVPGVVGVCFLLAGLGLAALRLERPKPGRRLALAPRAALGVALAVLAALVVSIYLGDVSIRKARTTSSSAPAERLDAAQTAEKLLPWSTAPLYLKAGAHEDLGERAAARDDLREALDLEPNNFVTYALLGDLEVRVGRERRARALYRRALELNPRDVGLRKLARGQFGS